MVSREVLEYAKEIAAKPLDSLSELFVINEFYEQLTDEKLSSYAGMHLRLAKLLESATNEEINIKFSEVGKVFYTFDEEGKLCVSIRKKSLLPYEAYLINNLAMR